MLKTVFDSPDWQTAVANLVGAADSQSLAEHLVSFTGLTVSNNGTSLLAFRKDAPPEVLHHSLVPSRARHYLDRYLAGPYLLDPLYQIALRADKPTMCRFRDTQPDRFHSGVSFEDELPRAWIRQARVSG